VSKLKSTFSKTEWEHCCGTHCGGCDVFAKYQKKYGKKKGRKKFDKDRKKLGLAVKE
jgi:hypothetical protein